MKTLNTAIDRRTFVKNTTAASIGLSMLSVPTILTGKDDRKAKIGLIGVGLSLWLLLRSGKEICYLCQYSTF